MICTIRRIDARETVPIRHSVLWPNHPVSHVLLEEDHNGYHYGAFKPGDFKIHDSTQWDAKPDDEISSRPGLEEKGEGGGGQSEEIVAVISLFFDPVPTSPSSPSPGSSHIQDGSLPHSDTALKAGIPSAPKSKDIDVGGTINPAETPRAIRFRKFACLPMHRGQGIGTLLLKESLRLANDEVSKGRQACIAWCDARVEAKEWYERRGMRELQNEGECTPARFYKGDVEYLRMVLNI